MRLTKALMVVAALSLITVACANSGTTSTGASGNVVNVSLFEWGVDPTPKSTASGAVTITAKNDGTEEHELIVVKDVALADLPKDASGHVLEDDLPAGALIGEISEFAAGTTASTTFQLEPGTYAIFCNILVEDEAESHFANGMANTIEVTA